MSDQQRLEKAWKLHERAQNDQGHEAITAAVLRDKILAEEKVSLEQLEAKFATQQTVPPTGRPAGWQFTGGNPFADAFNSFGGGFGGFGGGINPDIYEEMRKHAEAARRQREEAQRREAEAEFHRKRGRYTARFSPAICDLFEQLADVYKRDGSDLPLLQSLVECMQAMSTSEAQMQALSERMDAGELESKAAQQQAFRTLIRAGRKQGDTLQKLLAIVTTLVGGDALKDAAEMFEDNLGRRPR